MSDLQCRVQTGTDPPAITPCATFTLFPKLAPELRLKIWKQALPGPRLVEIRPDKRPLTKSHCNLRFVGHISSESIWRQALPSPRLVEIRPDKRPLTNSHCNTPLTNSHCNTPSVLHICSESRTEALKWYTALPLRLASDPLRYPDLPERLASDPLRVVYVNFQIDTIYFSRPTCDGYGWPFPWPCWPLPCPWPEYGYGVEGWVTQLFNNVRIMAMSYNAWEDIVMHAWTNVRSGREVIRFIQRFGNLEELTVVLFDDGTGEIHDEHELEVWDEWRIGDEVGVSIRTGEVQASDTDREVIALVEKDIMTRECGGLKNMKVRIAAFDRSSEEV